MEALKKGDRVWVERHPGYREKGTIVRAAEWIDTLVTVDVIIDGHKSPSSWSTLLVTKLNSLELMGEV